jgi:(1->4)-alpha-D-glucan 1-alpha-D-glucosylmutase
VAEPRSGFSRHSVVRVAMRVQQYSGPVMAKGLEDTAFYRFNRFVALNEVGGHPTISASRCRLPQGEAQRAARWPHAMLGTSTHDTKRGEDTRARLAGALRDAGGVGAAGPGLEPHPAGAARRRGGRGAARPQRRIPVLPATGRRLAAELTGTGMPGPEALRTFGERMEGAMLKSMREAKRHTTWAAPNTAYEEGMLGFVREALDPARSAASSTPSCPSRSASRASDSATAWCRRPSS